MTRRIVTASPTQTLESFAHSVLVSHHFKALPVINEQGVLLAMISLSHLRSVPMATWRQVKVADVMDARVRTLCPDHTVADAEALFAGMSYDAIPVVDPTTYRLVGIVSQSDIYRSLQPKTPELAA